MTEYEFVMELLRITDRYDTRDDLWWGFRPDLHFSINCSDAFWWATGDSEPIEPKDLEDLRRAYEDVKAVGGYHGSLLYVARRRGMRPQGAMFQYFDDPEVELFLATGPVRTSDTEAFGNPYTVEQALAKRDKQRAEREAKKDQQV